MNRAPVIGITAARRADEQAALVRSFGGIPRLAASVGSDRPAPDAEIAAALAPALATPLDSAVFLTGVGARHLIHAADRAGLGDELLRALGDARVLVRGGKPRGALRDAGVRVDWIAPRAHTAAVQEHLLTGAPMTGRRIMVQCAGAEPEPMVAALIDRGARVHPVHPYAIDSTADVRAVVALARDAAEGRVDALTFTNARAVDGFAAIAEDAGIDLDALTGAGTVLAAVGPTTAAALRAHGLVADVEPATPRMGAMYRALAEHLRQRTTQ